MRKVGIVLACLTILAMLASCGQAAGTPSATPGTQAPESATATAAESPAPSAETDTLSPTSSQSATPSSSPTLTPTSAATPEPEATAHGEATPAASPTPPELTYEQNAKYTPPPPLNLQASLDAQGRVVLTWSPPPPVTVPHVYSDVIDHYNIFRNQDGGDFSLLGSTSSTSFTDDGSSQSLTPGATYTYFVTAIHEGGTESAQSEKAAVNFLP